MSISFMAVKLRAEEVTKPLVDRLMGTEKSILVLDLNTQINTQYVYSMIIFVISNLWYNSGKVRHTYSWKWPKESWGESHET
jgi:hypothetical protein